MNKITKFIDKSGNFLNKIMAFLVGIFVSAIFFLFMLKALNGLGIFLALAVSFSLYFLLKKKYHKSPLLKPLNLGIFIFNIVTLVAGIIIYFTVYSLFQNLVS